MKNYFQNILLVTVSISICLVVGEIFTRLFIPVRNVGASFSEYDQTYGKSLKKNFSTIRITPEFTMKFSTNSQGFRGPEIETVSSSPIIYLGDSFTMGYGVNDGSEFPSLVGKSINPDGNSVWNSINAGIGDSGNGRWIKFLQGPAKKYNPGLVVLQVFTNDPWNNISEGLYTISENGELIEHKIRPKPIIHVVKEFIELIPGISDLYLVGLIRQVNLRYFFYQATQLSKTPANNQHHKGLALTIALVGTSIRVCKLNKWPVILLLAGVPGNSSLSKAIIGLARKENVEIVIVPEKSKRPELYYLTDGHWNTEGHRLAADMLLKEFSKWRSQNDQNPLGTIQDID